MDVIGAILGAIGTVVAMAVIIVSLAALFMIVFGIATGIDETVQR